MDKYVSAVIGHAIGDAMGVPIEFVERETLMENPITSLRKSYAGPAGTWSDDTSMEVATMDSFINKGKWDYDDIMNNFGEWLNNSKFTANNYTFDVGRTCFAAIRNYFENGTPAIESGMDGFLANGNGSLMRILPVAFYSYKKDLNKEEIYELTKNISSLTHKNEISILGCYIYVLYAINLFNGLDKNEAYNTIRNEDYSMFSNETIDMYKRVLKEDLNDLEINDINSSGYVVDTLEASLWTLLKANSYVEAILGAVNLGGDTDTIGAITGSMAGILFDDIPEKWIDKLQRKDYLVELSLKFEESI